MGNPLASVLAGRRIVALTGAGCSTESGIPDYRGAGRPTRRSPIQHDAFVRSAQVRRRYWARSTLGWPRFLAARPNAAHQALARLESAGSVAGVITQNVDRLHHRAGSVRVVELHGALEEALCLACGAREPRSALQGRLENANPGWSDRVALGAPDGDAELPAEEVAAFNVTPCLGCGGALKPDVVFFGGHVAEPTLDAAWSLFAEAEALLVVGSSLAVYSGFRFARRAAEIGLPIAIVNLGPTRADAWAEVRIQAPAGAVLPELAATLNERAALPSRPLSPRTPAPARTPRS